MSRRSRHRAAIAKSRRPIAEPANERIVAEGSVRPSAIAALRSWISRCPPEASFLSRPIRPTVSESNRHRPSGCRARAIGCPATSSSTTRSAVGAIGDAVERDGLAIQDELELMGQQRRVSLAHRGVEGLQVEAIDGVGDQVGREIIAGDGEVEGLQRLARRRAVVPSRDVVGLPARGGGRWSRFLADGSLSRRRRTSESEDDERKPKPEMQHGGLPCLMTRRKPGVSPDPSSLDREASRLGDRTGYSFPASHQAGSCADAPDRSKWVVAGTRGSTSPDGRTRCPDDDPSLESRPRHRSGSTSAAFRRGSRPLGRCAL